MKFINEYWHGNRSLSSAFWVVYFPATIVWVYSLFALAAGNVREEAPSVFILIMGVTILVRTLAIIVFWKCAPNNRRQSSLVAFLARGYILLDSSYLIVTAIALIGLLPML